MAKYPTLSVTLVARTTGSYGGQLVKPDSEATMLGIEFTKKIGFTQTPMGIVFTEFTKHPDGRLIRKPSADPHIDALSMLSRTPAVLVDATGMIRRVAGLELDNEAMFDHTLRELSN
jgi:hypothetical protein